jgi:transcriptional regulator with XRE-family HTH domain
MDGIEQIFRKRRIMRGVTQDQTAAAAGLSRKTVSDFENGASRIALGNLQRLLRTVGLELTAREASARPTLDELSDRYSGEETPKLRQRASRKIAR